jgi:hypothetical protein
MKATGISILLAALGLFAPGEARACQVPTPPAALRAVPADAIVLARITSVDWIGARRERHWRATARAWTVLSGAIDGPDFSFDNETHFRCGGAGTPRPGGYWILYLQRTGDGMRILDASAYWWTRQSGDPRLAWLNTLLPLGAVREPTPDEARMLDLAEPRVRLPAGENDLSAFTRIYARSSAGTLRVRLLRTPTPRRLMADESEEMPTEEICGCTLIEQFVDLDDLWHAGRLPPFGR